MLCYKKIRIADRQEVHGIYYHRIFVDASHIKLKNYDISIELYKVSLKFIFFTIVSCGAINILKILQR